METPSQDPRLPEYLVRTVRHDVGDFLQTVYSAVALLQYRLPAENEMERTILRNLRLRAGACKEMLDTLHDFVCPPSLSFASLSLTDLTRELAQSATARFPHLQIRVESEGPFPIVADGPRLGHVGGLMLANACQAARRQIVFRVAAAATPAEVEWTISDDGTSLSAEQLEQVFRPFPLSRRGTLEIGLAPARQIVRLHGGRIAAANLPDGGFQVQVFLPRQPPGEKST